MGFEGQAVQVLPLDDGFVELRFDLENDSINKLNALTMGELRQAIACLPAAGALRGLLVTSGKAVFIAGADVTEFVPIEHTGKNLMIRSVKTSPVGEARWVEEYHNLKSFWRLTPYLEKILDESYSQYLK